MWSFFPGWFWGVHPPAGASGAGLRHGVVGLGDRLWVGEPGRLSLDDRDWWRPEEKLRLVCSTDDCFEIFLKSDFRLGVRNPDSPQVPPPQWPGLPNHATRPASTLHGGRPAAHRSCVSRLRLRLLLRAMRPLVTFFRAGPTLMDVFSSAVVRRAILLPLCRKDGEGSSLCLLACETSTHLLVHQKPWILTTHFSTNGLPTHWAKDGCVPSVHPSNEPSTHPLVPGAIHPVACLLTCAHLSSPGPQPSRRQEAKMAQIPPPQGQGGPEGRSGVGPQGASWRSGYKG